MIPKTIHYCWFGNNKKPKMAEKCIKSWKKYCPEYQLVEWNESNFDIESNAYCKYCYDHKKWAFLSDLVRLLVVEEYGGIYFDTDVEVIKKPDELLKEEAFFGFENERNVASGLGFGACSHHPTVKAMIDEYNLLTKDSEGNFELIGCPGLNTNALKKIGLELNGKKQYVQGALILPEDYLNPYDDPTGVLRVTDNTISIHWYSKTWMSKRLLIQSVLTKPFHRVFGKNCFSVLKRKR